MQELIAFGKGVAPPLVAALLLVGALGRRWLSLAIAIGLAGAYLWLMGALPLPGASTDGVQWIVWSVSAVALIATATELVVLPPRVGVALAVLLLIAQPWLVLARVSERAIVPLATLGLAAAVFVLALRRDAQRRDSLAAPVVWTLVLSVDSLVILQAGSALLAQLAGAVAAALGTATCIAKLRRASTRIGAHVATLVAAHAALLIGGYYFTYLASLLATLAAALAPLGLALGGRADASPWRARLGIACSCAAMATATVAALAGGAPE